MTEVIETNETDNGEYIIMDETYKAQALDRCIMISDILNTHLFEHPFIQTTDGLSEKIEAIMNSLAEVYDEIEEHEIEPDTKYYFEDYVEDEEIEDEITIELEEKAQA